MRDLAESPLPTVPRVRRCFTLLEVLAAMAVLTVLTGFLFQFLISAQRAWSITETNARIYEGAQVVFDCITRDLQGAITSETDGCRIPFFAGKDTPINPEDAFLCFVAAVEPNTAADTKLCEVAYKLDATENTLRRSLQCDHDSGGNANDEWDFYNRGVDANGDGDPNDVTWITGIPSASWHTVVKGVESVAFSFWGRYYDRSASNDVEIGRVPNVDRPQVLPCLPMAVQISITLFDPKIEVVALREQSKRTFVKTVFLRGRS